MFHYTTRKLAGLPHTTFHRKPCNIFKTETRSPYEYIRCDKVTTPRTPTENEERRRAQKFNGKSKRT